MRIKEEEISVESRERCMIGRPSLSEGEKRDLESFWMRSWEGEICVFKMRLNRAQPMTRLFFIKTQSSA